MEPRWPRCDPHRWALPTAAGWAVAAALAGRECGLAAACLLAATALLWTVHTGRAGPWLWALPAGLAAAVQPPPPLWPPAGPVAIAGVVEPGVRVDPVRGDCTLRLRSHHQSLLCVVVGAPPDFQALPGDRLTGFARLPDQPDRRRRGGLPRVVASHDALHITPGGPTPTRLAAACRLAMQRGLLAAVDGQAGVLLCHLVLGSGPELGRELIAAHRATGLSHLLAVSGAHLTMLAWLLGCTFAAVTRRAPLASRRFRWGCAAILGGYGLLTGLEPPVFRAVVAMFVVLVAGGRGRPVPWPAVLALPATLTAVCAPQDLFGISFNLSYAAVIGLGLAGGFAHSWTGRWLTGPLRCSLWATACTMPLTLWYFGTLAPWTLLATPLLSPLVAGMLGLGLLVATLVPLLPAVGGLLALPLAGLTTVYCTAVRWCGELPLAPVHAVCRPAPVALGLAGLVGVVALLHLRDRRGIAALCAMLAVPHFLPPPAAAPVGVQLLAVGHGHAGLLRLRDRTTVLVDCGNLGNPRRAARVAAAAVLPARRLDLLVLTHGDADHVAGVPELLDRLRVVRVVLPTELLGGTLAAALRAHGCALDPLPPGRAHRPHPDLLVHRPVATPTNRNDGGAWVHAELGAFRAVLTGDALEAGTLAWLRSPHAAPADVLVLPHHGRRHGAADRLAAFVQPALALVSSAASDGISAQGRAVAATGIPVLHTGRVGTVSVHATDPVTVTTEFPRLLAPRTRR